MRIKTQTRKLIVCASLLSIGTAFAADRVWTGGAGTTVLNTAGNWSGNATPGAADVGIFDGTVMTNVPFVWNANNWNGSGNVASSFIITNYPQAIVWNGDGSSGTLLCISNITIAAGSGPFTLGDDEVVSGTVFRSGGPHLLINDSIHPARIGPWVVFNSSGGGGKTITFGGSGSWQIDAPWQLAGAGSASIRVEGTGANVLTLNGPIGNGSGFSHTIASGTLRVGSGDALAAGGTQTLTIEGGAGVKRFSLTNDIWLNPAVANINIAGREDASGAANAAIESHGENYINGVIRFNAVGGTNVGIYNHSGTLTVNGNASQLALTAANVTGNRQFVFGGAGTTVVQGNIENGSAVLGLRLTGGNLVLSGINTHSGNTVVDAGVLRVGSDQALQNSTVILNGGTLDLNGGMTGSPVVGGLAGAGTVTSQSGGMPQVTVGNNNASTTFSGSINNGSGTVAVRKVGSGTLTLSGASTFSGGLTVESGTVLAGNTTGSATGSGAVTVNPDAVFGGSGSVQGQVSWQSGSSARFILTPSAVVAGSNTTILAVSGNVTLDSTPVVIEVAGSTPLQVGTYRLMTYNNAGSSGAFSTVPTFVGAGVALGTASTISTAGGVVTLTVSFTGNISIWTNDNDGVWNAGANWSSNPYYPQAAGDSATLGVGSAYRTVSLNAPVSVGTIQFTNENSFLIANGGGTLTLANSSGPAVISVQAGASNAIASPVSLNADLAVTTAAGASLTLGNAVNNSSGLRTVSVTGQGALILNGNNSYGPTAGSIGTIVNGGVLQLGANTAAGAGDLSVSNVSTIRAGAPLSLGNNIVANSASTAVIDNNGNDVTISGTITGSGGVTKEGSGVLTLASANSYTGNTVVNGGTLRIGEVGAIPSGFGNGTVTVNTNGTLDLNGGSHTINGLNGAGIVDTLAGGSAVLTIGESGAGGTFTGSLRNTAGTLAIVKNGGGTQTLAGTNTYTGGTTINAGTLQIGNGGTSGNLGSGSLVNNANLAFNLTGSNVFAGNISGSGTVTLANVGLNLWLTGNNTFTGNVQNNGGTLWITNSSALGVGPKTVIAVGNFASQFTQLRLAGNVNIDPSITFRLSYSGGVLVNEAGTNTIQGMVEMPNGGGNPLIVVNSGFLTLAGDVSTVPENNARTLTLDGPGDGLVSGNIYDNGPAASVAKNGTGTWTLSGPGNSYSGTTAVNAGTLLITGNNYGAGAVTVASGAAFGGTGTVGSAVTWQAGSTGVFSVSPSGGMNNTPFMVSGTVTLNNNAITVNVPGGTPLPVGTYLLMSAPTINGAFTSTPVITGAGLAPNTFGSVVTADGQVNLVVAQSSVWVNNGNGNWSTLANWNSNPNIPDAAGEYATFGVGSSLTTVTLDSPKTIGGIVFTNPNSFVISSPTPANTLTLNNNGNNASINVLSGSGNVIAAAANLADNTIVSVSTSNTLSIPSSVTGNGLLTKSGNGVLVLSGSNSFSGTLLAGGTLALGSTNALGDGMFTISGGSLDSRVPGLVNRRDNPQTWSGSFAFLGSQSLHLGNGGVTLTANLTVGISNSTLTVGGPIDGPFNLTVDGTTNGTIVLENNNSFTGFTALGGTIVIGSDTALGSAGTLQFTPQIGPGVRLRSKDATPRTIANNVSVNAFDGPYILDGPGDLTFTGSIVSGNGQKRFTVNNTTTFAGPVTDNGAPNGPLIIDGTGRLILPIANSMTKTFQVSGATIVLGDSMAFGSGPLVLNGGALDTTIPDMVLVANNVQTWSGSFGFAGTENLNLGSGNVSLTTNVTVTVSNKVLTVDGVITGSFAITKAGAGRLVLNGANNYGNTVVTAGVLEIAQATLRTNSTVSIASGATLQLNFSVTNRVAGLVLNGVAQPAGVYKSGNSAGLISGPGALEVVPLGPTEPAVLTSTVAGNQLSLSWPAGQGWRLQAQTNSLNVGLSNNWTYLTDGSVTSTNITIDPAAPAVFYRLVYP